MRESLREQLKELRLSGLLDTLDVRLSDRKRADDSNGAKAPPGSAASQKNSKRAKAPTGSAADKSNNAAKNS